MSTTQQNIADRLGVSKMSVARALNGGGKVSEATRQRILETAQEMGYSEHSSGAARALIARRYGKTVTHGTIGLLQASREEMPLPYYAHLFAGIYNAAHELGVETIVIQPEPSAGWEKVDGIIGHGEKGEAVMQRMASPIPYVGIGESIKSPWCVEANDEDGVRQAVQHLLALGHRKIGYLADASALSVRRRVSAFRQTLRDAGMELNPLHEWQLWEQGPMENSGRFCMETWLDNGFRKQGLTALLVQNDRAAIGAMAALREAGIRVPEDISIVGFDSTDECELSTPRLTSVRVPLEAIGVKAVELLLRQISDEKAEPETARLPVELEIRASTAALQNATNRSRFF